MLNHVAVPANQLAALVKELLEATDGSELLGIGCPDPAGSGPHGGIYVTLT